MAKCSVSQQDTKLSFAFAHGGSTNVDLTTFNPDIIQRFAIYGMRQKLQDSYSGQKEPEKAQAALEALLTRLQAGEWTATQRASGGTSATTKLVQAIHNLNPGKSIEELQTLVDALDDAQLKALRARPAVAAELARMRAEELAAKASEASGEIDGLLGQI